MILRSPWGLAAVSVLALALAAGASCGGSSTPGPFDGGDDAGPDGGDAGPLATILDPSARPDGLAVDHFNAYWTDANNAVRKVQLGAGGQESTIATGVPTPSPIVLLDDKVYFGGLVDDGGVWSAPKVGGTATLIVAGENYVQAMAIEPGRIWWTSWAQPHTPSTAQIRSAPLDGGAPETLTTGLNYARAIAIDADAVYVASDNLKRVDRGDGGVTVLSTVVRPTLTIVADATSVYYADRDTGGIMKVARTGGAPVKLGQIPVAQEPSNVWLDRATDTLYVSLFARTGQFGGVYKVRTTGGAVELVANSWGLAGFGTSPLAVDADTVYFGAGALFQTPK